MYIKLLSIRTGIDEGKVQQERGHTSVDRGLWEPMDCPLARIISVDTFGVLGFTGSLTVNVDPLPATKQQMMRVDAACWKHASV